ncbi:MAG: hypothetical protein HOB84_08895 [Candidatus Marinimicrobia bacterium]|nr:hypothetical protein [Candidatus Neomarinimicrobiota bacterium]MBT4362538.1 hypothetical protein [Candidatus Neomarinimicrobiota bacterium]MBT4714877.1 hypothetical protein [Candidatus Neomarinimicrobiota bacterium]MBT4947323.1 hypothetical protein [Candidatus Neomarinimicrobiota bacterium]MBT5269464.1 hypothetical protein [Candidatus Neomarinimicrobiota bacterium]
MIKPSTLGHRFRKQIDLRGPFRLINSNAEMMDQELVSISTLRQDQRTRE